MISTKSLLLGLTALISFDIILTACAVGYMGATEINVLVTLLGFPGFMVFKIVVSAVAVYTIYKYCLPSAPTITKCGVAMLIGVYGVVSASNVYQIMGAVA